MTNTNTNNDTNKNNNHNDDEQATTMMIITRTFIPNRDTNMINDNKQKDKHNQQQ